MSTFSFTSADTILFGPGTLAQAAARAVEMGRHALVVTGRHPERAVVLTQLLTQAGLTFTGFSVPGEPEIAQACAGAQIARENKCDLVIGFGGGSALDAAKAIAALATNTQPVETYLEVIGRGLALDQSPLPCIAIPTTAGTGSEVTRNAVLKSTAHSVKVSLRSPQMLPDLAVIDPELTLGLPADITAATGCDALTQLLEAFVSAKANPLTDALCREGLTRAARSLPQAVAHGDHLQARTDMAIASLFSGLALANAGLGAVHGIAGPLGGMIDAPHGALCAQLLSHVVEFNVTALRQRQPDNAALDRYQTVARLLTGDSQAHISDGIRWLHRLTAQLAIPKLTHWGFKPDKVPLLVASAQRASSMKGNPIHLTDDELTGIITQAMQGHCQ
jgi:alcohol dehydrogenase class IV